MKTILHVDNIEKYYGSRGNDSRKDFFHKILEVVTLLGGDTSNVL